MIQLLAFIGLMTLIVVSAATAGIVSGRRDGTTPLQREWWTS